MNIVLAQRTFLYTILCIILVTLSVTSQGADIRIDGDFADWKNIRVLAHDLPDDAQYAQAMAELKGEAT